MKRISTTEIKDDMVLAEDLAGPNGNIILPKGVKLKASLSPRLSGWGINDIAIESADEEGSEDTEIVENIEERLRPLFIKGLDTEISQTLLKTLVQVRENSH